MESSLCCLCPHWLHLVHINLPHLVHLLSLHGVDDASGVAGEDSVLLVTHTSIIVTLEERLVSDSKKTNLDVLLLGATGQGEEGHSVVEENLVVRGLGIDHLLVV